jgi:hypothetical protein
MKILHSQMAGHMYFLNYEAKVHHDTLVNNVVIFQTSYCLSHVNVPLSDLDLAENLIYCKQNENI